MRCLLTIFYSSINLANRCNPRSPQRDKAEAECETNVTPRSSLFVNQLENFESFLNYFIQVFRTSVSTRHQERKMSTSDMDRRLHLLSLGSFGLYHAQSLITTDST
jgi:hypothetical protein